MSTLSDQTARERFATEMERNFSVVAPAGVGKTTAIVHRIVHAALTDDIRREKLLPNLVVVTYTEKAAMEMRDLARRKLMLEKTGPDAFARLNQAFFGTIHGFCFKLLRQHGSVLGLPSSLEAVENEENLWIQFCRQSDSLAAALPEDVRRIVLRHCALEDILPLARRIPPCEDLKMVCPGKPSPQIHTRHLFDYQPKRRNKGVEEAKQVLRDWLKEYERGSGHLPLPVYQKNVKDFKKLWRDAFQPLRDWLAAAALYLAADVSRQFLRYRISRGKVTFDDQTGLAGQLLRHHRAGPVIRALGLRIILDEAQDTDARQFEVLTEAARPSGAKGIWLKDGGAAPEPGRFCMVGDPQQSIYSERADLPVYQKLHRDLCAAGAAEKLIFNVTMRCGRAAVRAVNQCFPAILRGSGQPGGQVDFVALEARPEADGGQTIRLPLSVPGSAAEGKAGERAAVLSEVFAEWLKNTSMRELRARSRSEAAILCPRKDWLEALFTALRNHGIEAQLLSRERRQGDNPAYAWLTALLTIAAQPWNEFEIFGVMREIFGLPDHDIAVCGHPLKILYPAKADGPVAETLNLLCETRQRALAMPLREAVRHWSEAVSLPQRLAALPDYHTGELLHKLDELMLSADRAESGRLSLQAWAEQLREGFSQCEKEEARARDAHPLLSCHKAKGMGWDAVIIPFFHHCIGFPPPRYPCAARDEAGRPAVILDSEHVRTDLRMLAECRRREETERLLYVAMTRARHTLVLADDAEFFGKTGPSFAQCLQILPGETNRAFWESLPGKLTAAEEKPPAGKTEKKPPPLSEPFTQASFKKAAENLARMPRRVLPSSLARKEETAPCRDEPELRIGLEFDEEAPPYPANVYGNWWHGMMETAPWNEPPDAWRRHFKLCLPGCPDPARGENETARFLDSPLARMLAGPGAAVLTEVPFLWKADEQTIYEGLMDLAMRDSEKQTWLVVDWKTDRVEADPATVLRRRYAPQIEAYRAALEAVFQLPAAAAFYSTPAAAFISAG